jgi:hypothetical protein
MRRVPLLERGPAIGFQYRVDERQRLCQLRPIPFRLLPLWRNRAGQSLAHLTTMYSQSPCYCADRSGAMFVLPPDLFV